MQTGPVMNHYTGQPPFHSSRACVYADIPIIVAGSYTSPKAATCPRDAWRAAVRLHPLPAPSLQYSPASRHTCWSELFCMLLAAHPVHFSGRVYGQRRGMGSLRDAQNFAHSGSTGYSDNRHDGATGTETLGTRTDCQDPRAAHSHSDCLGNIVPSLCPGPNLLKPTRPLGIKISNWYVGRGKRCLSLSLSLSLPCANANPISSSQPFTKEARTTAHPRTTAPCSRG
ncbi:hypothetical protein LY76DRAFT_214283 [Colletotrichum caudatum]|nr:hypothetical protein LY76DRAFT_214283 [Colletotrichum caudatum]